jgi:hypothetical protein
LPPRRTTPVTEAEWQACDDPQPMLECLHGKASDRKLRLFACACARRVPNQIINLRIQGTIEVAERYADGAASAVELTASRNAAPPLPPGEYLSTADSPAPHNLIGRWVASSVAWAAGDVGEAAMSAVKSAASVACEAAAYGAATSTDKDVARVVERKAQAGLLRCVIGPRILPVNGPTWLNWNGGAVVNLAATIYEARDFDRLPLLADALEDAGCGEAEMLGHLREPGPHVRGCWAVDLILSKDR